jgi:hypothetical protein
MKKLETIKNFLHQNNEDDLFFQSLELFPQTKLYLPFGIGIKEGRLTFNTTSCYKRPNSFLYDTFSPFTFEECEYKEKEQLLILYNSFNFSVRIFFFKKECFSSLLLSHIEKNKKIEKNSFLGISGKQYLKNNFISCVQIVSEKENEILLDLLKIKYPSIELFTNYPVERLLKLFDIYGIEHKQGFTQFEEIRKEAKAYFLNDFLSKQYDPIVDKEIFFYSWNFLF